MLYPGGTQRDLNNAGKHLWFIILVEAKDNIWYIIWENSMKTDALCC